MTQRRYTVLLAFALCAGVAALSGCGPTDSGNASFGQNQQVAKGDVTVAAAFPTADGAVKSLIPAAARAIDVYAQAQPYTYDPLNPNGLLIATLTPTESSKTVTIAAGKYMMYAIAWDSADNSPTSNRTQVGRTTAGGEVLAGQANTIVLTFMEGQWTVVDANDAPSSVVLSNGVALNDFIVGGDSGAKQPYKAGKSAIDYSKPVGYGGGMMRIRFSGYTSARTYGGMESQFNGTTTTLVHASGYNMTKKCSNYTSSSCSDDAGNQIVMVSGKEGGSERAYTPTDGTVFNGSPYDLLPNKGQTTFTQNGTAIDLMAAFPDSIVTGGNLITGAVVEWLPSSSRLVSIGTPAAAKRASAKAVMAQSSNTAYTGLAIKNYNTLVCSGANPQNRGTWSFANNTSAGKIVVGTRVCYDQNSGANVYLGTQYNAALMQYVPNAGDYSYGLVPTSTDYGDYCHVWDYTMNTYTNGALTPNPNYNTCKQQLPGTGDVYNPWNFRAVKTAAKTAISFGSFKFNFWGEENQTGSAYIYPFRAKGSTAISPAR